MFKDYLREKNTAPNVSGAIRHLKKIGRSRTIFHLGWSEWALLFGLNPENKFICGLDPAFLYNYDETTWRDWRGIELLNDLDYPLTIKERFGSTTVLALRNYRKFCRYAVRDPRMRTLYADDVAYVFALADETYSYPKRWEVSGVYVERRPPNTVKFSEKIDTRQFVKIKKKASSGWIYLRTRVDRENSGNCRMRFGSWNKSRVLSNGESLVKDDSVGLPVPDEVVEDVELVEGINEFVVEVRMPCRGFFLSISD